MADYREHREAATLQWTPQSRKAFHSALESGFKQESLARTLRHRLGKRMDLITSASGFSQVVDDVMDEAEREGWLDDLVRATLQANPGNNELSRFVAGILTHSGIAWDSFFPTSIDAQTKKHTQNHELDPAPGIRIADVWSTDTKEGLGAIDITVLNRGDEMVLIKAVNLETIRSAQLVN